MGGVKGDNMVVKVLAPLGLSDIKREHFIVAEWRWKSRSSLHWHHGKERPNFYQTRLSCLL
jgi:hypothetical protein